MFKDNFFRSNTDTKTFGLFIQFSDKKNYVFGWEFRSSRILSFEALLIQKRLAESFTFLQFYLNFWRDQGTFFVSKDTRRSKVYKSVFRTCIYWTIFYFENFGQKFLRTPGKLFFWIKNNSVNIGLESRFLNSASSGIFHNNSLSLILFSLEKWMNQPNNFVSALVRKKLSLNIWIFNRNIYNFDGKMNQYDEGFWISVASKTYP